jgi:hypothetical protein
MTKKRLVWGGLAIFAVLFAVTDCTASIKPLLAAEMHLLVRPGMKAATAQAALSKVGFRCDASDAPDHPSNSGVPRLASTTSWLNCRRDRNDKIIGTCAQIINLALDGGSQSVLETFAEQPRCTSV